MVRYAGDDMTLKEAEELYDAMPKNSKEEINESKVLFEAINKGRKTKAARDTELKGEIDPDSGVPDFGIPPQRRIGAGLQGEMLRRRLASSWMESLLKNK